MEKDILSKKILVFTELCKKIDLKLKKLNSQQEGFKTIYKDDFGNKIRTYYSNDFSTWSIECYNCEYSHFKYSLGKIRFEVNENSIIKNFTLANNLLRRFEDEVLGNSKPKRKKRLEF